MIHHLKYSIMFQFTLIDDNGKMFTEKTKIISKGVRVIIANKEQLAEYLLIQKMIVGVVNHLKKTLVNYGVKLYLYTIIN